MSWLSALTALAVGPPGQVPPRAESVAVRFHPRGEEGILLEGVLQVPTDAEPPFPGMVLCHPDPRMGGTMDDVVVLACVRALIARGIAVLRFNFRGVEGSTGEFADGTGCVPDVLGALDSLRGGDGIDRDRIFLGGYSLGAATALKALPEAGQVCGYAAVALPFTGAPAEREEFACVEAVKAPLFVVIGEMDQYGSAEAIRRFLQQKPAQSEMVVIPQADHFLRAPADALDQAADSLSGFVKARAEAGVGG